MNIKERWMMRQATKEEDVQEYISDPNHCPFCKSENISAGNFEDEGLSAGFRIVTCDDCHLEWDEVWHMVDMEPTYETIEELKKREGESEEVRKWEERWHKR